MKRKKWSIVKLLTGFMNRVSGDQKIVAGDRRKAEDSERGGWRGILVILRKCDSHSLQRLSCQQWLIPQREHTAGQFGMFLQ